MVSGPYNHNCPCQSGKLSWWELDAQGIPLCRVCEDCVEERLSHYRPEILNGYSQNDVDEQIEPEPSYDCGGYEYDF